MIKLKNLLNEAEINYSKEKSWNIKEKRPIKVKVVKAGNYYRVEVPPMKMRYDTYEDLDDYGGGAKGHTNVSVSSYDYENGEATFTANSIDDIKDWIAKNKKIIKN